MKVGDLVRVPSWQLKRNFWSEHRDFGTGLVFEITPYAVHVRWSNGRYITYKFRHANMLEVLK